MKPISVLDLTTIKRGSKVKVSSHMARDIIPLDMRDNDFFSFEVDYAALTYDNKVYIVTSIGKCFYLPASQYLILE